jgi:hypothetical protein
MEDKSEALCERKEWWIGSGVLAGGEAAGHDRRRTNACSLCVRLVLVCTRGLICVCVNGM